MTCQKLVQRPCVHCDCNGWIIMLLLVLPKAQKYGPHKTFLVHSVYTNISANRWSVSVVVQVPGQCKQTHIITLKGLKTVARHFQSHVWGPQRPLTLHTTSERTLPAWSKHRLWALLAGVWARVIEILRGVILFWHFWHACGDSRPAVPPVDERRCARRSRSNGREMKGSHRKIKKRKLQSRHSYWGSHATYTCAIVKSLDSLVGTA